MQTPFRRATLLVVTWVFVSACGAGSEPSSYEEETQEDFGTDESALTLVESFEAGTKSTYAAATTTLGTGPWLLSDALIGTTTSDRKEGLKSVRLRNQGFVRMMFDRTTGAGSITLKHAKFGADPSSQWEVRYSLDGGLTWRKAGSTVTTSSTAFWTRSFLIRRSGVIRFEIRKTSIDAARLNLDDISISDYAGLPATPHLELGTPTDLSSTDDHLLGKPQFALSYNSRRNGPNWVSWNLDASHYGTVTRYTGNFYPDASLPADFYKVTHSDYTNSGYDRGHMVRSEERTATVEDNKATFVTTNILPQYNDLNAGPWYKLETYCQMLAQLSGKELYVVAGGLYPSVPATIGNGVAVPSSTYKIVVVLEQGQRLADVNSSTRVIAVNMPNVTGIRTNDWKQYRVSVDRLESLSGYNFLSNVPASIQNVIEAQIDAQ